MSVTMQQVLAIIDKDEPNYSAAAQLGPEALPHLRLIIQGNDPLRASKAAYAATLIGGPGAADLLKTAAEHSDPQVRLAVAHGLKKSADADKADVLKQLLDDADAGVRKVALSTAADAAVPELHDKVADMAQRDPEEYVRSAASKAVQKQKQK